MSMLGLAMANVLAKHQYDLGEAMQGVAACTCGETITSQSLTIIGVDRDLARHQVVELGKAVAS